MNGAHGTRPGWPEPVFILSPPRSYSTVTTALLAGHPEVFGLPEMLTFSAPTIGDLLSGIGCLCAQSAEPHEPESCPFLAVRLSGPYRAIAELHEGGQHDAAIRRARRWLKEKSDWPGERLLDHLLGLVAPRIGLEKSPDTVRSDKNLARCISGYPGARYIHLTRHPVTAQRSLQQHLSLGNPSASPRRQAAQAATIWYRAHVRITGALGQLPPEQSFRVRGEDLLRSPQTWLPRILGWLGLEAGPDTVATMLLTERWPFAGTGTSGRLFGGDHKFMLSPELSPVPEPGPLDFEPAWGLLDEMRARMSKLANHLGYPS
jgi:hypothetical protein